MDGLSAVYAWFKYFKGQDWILPILGALAAGVYFSWKLKKLKNEMIDDLNVALGGFRVEVRKLVTGAKDSLANSARKAREVVEAPPKEAQQEKAQKANAEAKLAADAAAGVDEAKGSIDGEAEERRNWGEVSTLWVEAWDLIKGLRTDAIDFEKGRAKGHLRELDLRKPVDVILKLFNYGWLSDEATDHALEMAEIYLKHRPRGRVNSTTLNRFREASDKFWKE